MKTYYCVYAGFSGCTKTLWNVYETELDAKWGKISAQSYGYEAEIRIETEEE